MKKEKIKTDFVTMSRKAKDSLPSDLTKIVLNFFKKPFSIEKIIAWIEKRYKAKRHSRKDSI